MALIITDIQVVETDMQGITVVPRGEWAAGNRPDTIVPFSSEQVKPEKFFKIDHNGEREIVVGWTKRVGEVIGVPMEAYARQREAYEKMRDGWEESIKERGRIQERILTAKIWDRIIYAVTGKFPAIRGEK